MNGEGSSCPPHFYGVVFGGFSPTGSLLYKSMYFLKMFVVKLEAALDMKSTGGKCIDYTILPGYYDAAVEQRAM